MGIVRTATPAPASEARPGRCTHDIDAQGLADIAAANAAAEAAYLADQDALSFVSFTGTPDPRHDSFNVVSYDGINYLELSWSLELRPGGAHQHDLARVYG